MHFTKANIIAPDTMGPILDAVLYQLSKSQAIYHEQQMTVLGVEGAKMHLKDEMVNIQRQVRMVHQLFEGVLNRKCLANDVQVFDLEVWLLNEQNVDLALKELETNNLLNHWDRLSSTCGLPRSRGYFLQLK